MTTKDMQSVRLQPLSGLLPKSAQPPGENIVVYVHQRDSRRQRDALVDRGGKWPQGWLRKAIRDLK